MICVMILTPYALDVASLGISLFKRTKSRSLPAILLASLGCAWGLWLAISFGLSKIAEWMDLALFIPLPLGVLALFMSLKRGKEDA